MPTPAPRVNTRIFPSGRHRKPLRLLYFFLLAFVTHAAFFYLFKARHTKNSHAHITTPPVVYLDNNFTQQIQHQPELDILLGPNTTWILPQVGPPTKPSADSAIRWERPDTLQPRAVYPSLFTQFQPNVRPLSSTPHKPPSIQNTRWVWDFYPPDFASPLPGPKLTPEQLATAENASFQITLDPDGGVILVLPISPLEEPLASLLEEHVKIALNKSPTARPTNAPAFGRAVLRRDKP